MNLDEDLLDAVLEAKRMKKRGALRRQKQYIGKLMGRLEDPEPVRAALERVRARKQ
jgi:ribosome-associated protein